ncbi:B12-binding domain-containing radical SAM protein [Geomonas sp. Red276]
MKITLVTIHPRRSPQAVPLACAFLKSVLDADAGLAARVSSGLCDLYLETSAEEGAREILSADPDLVAFSVYVWCREETVEVARALKRLKPGLTVCAGGPEVTANPSPLTALAPFDFLVMGEGEGPFREAVRRLASGGSLRDIPGLLLPGGMSALPSPPFDLEAIPSPYLEGLLDPAATGGVLWQLSRGCDFACAFCFDHKGGGGVRRFPMERIREELKLFARLKVPQVFVLDSTFNKIPQRAKEILRLIRKTAPGVHFHFEVRSEFIDEEMAELFASITCSLQIGLQSAHPAVMRAVGRGFDPDDFRDRVMLLNETGAIFGFDLIYGLPGDSLPLFCQSLDFALALYPNHLDIFPLAVLPGTRLHRKADQFRLAHLPDPPYTVTSTPEFTAADLTEASLLATACDVFYSRGKAVAWFNAVVAPLRLTPSAFLAAFGAFLKKRGAVREEEIPEEEIWELQRRFLGEMYGGRKARLLPLALDLVDYHHRYAQALMAEPPLPLSGRQLKGIDPLRRPLALAPSAFLATFNYEILDILEAGEMDLPAFASCFRPSPSWAIIYPGQGEVCTESVSEAYYRLLTSLDGRRPAGEIGRELSIPRADLLSFLEFALSEGIVTPA